MKIQANTANLRMATQIADESSLSLEATQIDQARITKREVDQWNDETIEERHFVNKFQGANIHINQSASGSTRHVERAIEYKCPSCLKRVMSIRSLNEHMEFCPINVLDQLFSQFKVIYSKRISKQLTTLEYVLHAIRLIFDTQKKLEKIVKEQNVTVDAITTEIPPEIPPLPKAQKQLHRNAQRHNFMSPDNGYASGHASHN